jgi:hypothetical protein
VPQSLTGAVVTIAILQLRNGASRRSAEKQILCHRGSRRDGRVAHDGSAHRSLSRLRCSSVIALELSQAASGLPAHTVHATAGRRRRRAHKQAWVGCSVGNRPKRGSEKELQQRCFAAVDVAPDQIRVVPLEVGWMHHVTSQDAIAESGRVPFDLVLQSFGHIGGAPVGHVTVRPPDVLSGRGSR